MKKIFIWNVCIAFVLSLFLVQPQATEASTTYSAVVNTDSLNVRAKASGSSEKLGSLKKGTKVTVYVKNKNGWATILYKNKKAYVTAKYLKYPKATTTSELKTLKTAATKGTTPNSGKIKLGDNPQTVINKYGKTLGWGMREYYVLEYPKFSAMYMGIADGSGEYPLFNSKTKIYNISSNLSKSYTLKEIRAVFGNSFTRGYDHIPMEVFVVFKTGKYKVYFTAQHDNPDVNLNSLKFKNYSVVDF